MNQVVLFIIIANVLTSMKGFKDYSFINAYKFQVNRILAGEKIRMLTSGFLHVDWTHLGFNMYALHLFGGIVTNGMGTLFFVIIYIGSLITGSLYTLNFHKKEPYYSAVGASGAVSGVLFSAIILAPNKLYSFIFFPFIDIPGYILGVGYLIYSIYGMKKQLGNVGHSAHLGGAMGGFLLTLILKPELFAINSFKCLFIGNTNYFTLIFW